jgi:protein tyrosine/serine phosphatase
MVAMISRRILLAAFVIAVLPAWAWAQNARPANWAEPIRQQGLPNLHRVTPNLYRGAQPTAAGMRNLEQMGIKTVVNLRDLHDDRSKLKGTQLRYVRLRVNTFHPDYDEMVAFLKAATDPANQPVFVHCQHGADRTGMMVALYRIAVQGWSKADAIRELKDGGYNFHSIWLHIPRLIEEVDVVKLRKDAGIPSP